MGRLIFIMLAVLAVSAHAADGAGHFDYGTQLGVAEANVAAYGCLAIANDTLQEGEVIQLINPVAPQAVVTTAIRKKLTASCSRNATPPRGATFYSIRSVSEPLDPAIAIARYPGDIRAVNGTVRLDLNGNGTPETFRSCTGSEGVHLTVWEHDPPLTRRLWHQYFHLGYGVEPTCTPQESGE